MNDEGLSGIFRAGGCEAAGWWRVGRYEALVEHDGQQQAACEKPCDRFYRMAHGPLQGSSHLLRCFIKHFHSPFLCSASRYAASLLWCVIFVLLALHRLLHQAFSQSVQQAHHLGMNGLAAMVMVVEVDQGYEQLLLWHILLHGLPHYMLVQAISLAHLSFHAVAVDGVVEVSF